MRPDQHREIILLLCQAEDLFGSRQGHCQWCGNQAMHPFTREHRVERSGFPERVAQRLYTLVAWNDARRCIAHGGRQEHTDMFKHRKLLPWFQSLLLWTRLDRVPPGAVFEKVRQDRQKRAAHPQNIGRIVFATTHNARQVDLVECLAVEASMTSEDDRLEENLHVRKRSWILFTRVLEMVEETLVPLPPGK